MTRAARLARGPRAAWIALAMAVFAGAVPAASGKELLVGTAAADGASLAFRITGNSREDVMGGTMSLGDARYTIQRVSQRGLIGASRLQESAAGTFAEFVVFSSSFSAQTAVGQPWVVAAHYHRCDQPYNSFLAVYRVNGKPAVEQLGPVPYPILTRDLKRSDEATVYCFVSAPE